MEYIRIIQFKALKQLSSIIIHGKLRVNSRKKLNQYFASYTGREKSAKKTSYGQSMSFHVHFI